MNNYQQTMNYYPSAGNSYQPNSPKIKPTSIVILGIVILMIAILIGVIAFALSAYNKSKIDKCTERTDGVIVEIICSNEDGYDTKRTTYRPIVEYTVGSETYSHKVTNPGRKHTFEIGEKMEVYYEPDNPDNAFVEREEAGNSIASKVMFVCAGLNVLFAIILFIRAAQVRKRMKY